MTLPGVSEKPILDRLCFSVRGTTFATEGWPEEGWAVVKLDPDDQRQFMSSIAIRPESGERGAGGITLIRLQGVDDALLTDVLVAAWRRAYGGHQAVARGTAGVAADRGAPEIGDV